MAKKASLKSLFRRMVVDQGGNTLILTAVAVFPILAMLGGGLDVARAHLVKSRLSQACDSAALAGRRAMSRDILATAVPEATRFFNYNFPQRYMGTATFTPAITQPDPGVVRVAANTTVPTTLMRVFGFNSIPVSVSCDAMNDFNNIDILLVLDTTGSMSRQVGNNNNDVGDNAANSRMQAMRDGVMELYDELALAQSELENEGLRLRYGIVPYSSTVNVGRQVRAVNTSYIFSGNRNYWSRVPVFDDGEFEEWNYRQVSYNLSNFVTDGGTLTAPTGNNGTNLTHTWGGCIEERDTVTSINGNTAVGSIPANAHDLNINLIPNSDATRWRPYLAGPYISDSNYASHVWSGSGSSGSRPQMACPAPARRLGRMTRQEMLNYVNGLWSDGGTYHDIGMIWGTRFISPLGIFGPDNPSTFPATGGREVRRFIIFMTDGVLETGNLYSAYGLENRDRRVTGGNTSGAANAQTERHRRRFLMACNAARSMDISVWTIVFDVATEPSLTACADPGQARSAMTGAELNSVFADIGRRIGALRLRQ